jgi:hypothetical protein
MITKKLFNSNSIRDEDGSYFRVDYFITESHSKLNDTGFRYGICLRKNPCECPGDIFSASGCFMDEANAMVLLDKLHEYKVTPICACESIEAVIESCNFKY